MLHHTSAERSPGDRGREFGRLRREAVDNTVRVYRRLLHESAGIHPDALAGFGEEVGHSVAARWPDLVEELEGIAAGSANDVRELLALNARTELLGPAGPGECSVLGRVTQDGVVLSQNWDWHPDLRASRVVWSVRQPEGGWFATLTEAGLLAKIGLNSAGLAVGLNFLTWSGDGGLQGLPIHVLLRAILDRCATATDALVLLLGAPVSASSSLTIAGDEPDGCALISVELSPHGHSVVFPTPDGGLAHTNHFLRTPTTGVDTQPVEHPSTLLRLDRLRRHLATDRPVHEVLASHFPRPDSICLHDRGDRPWADRRATLASVIIDPGSGTFAISDGAPCEADYRPVDLPG